MISIPFRLSPCDNPSEASADALSFGRPDLYDHLATLGRIKIEAESPWVRAGTVWFKTDREYCTIEAVAIRPDKYPLCYKVLAEMVAAQLGFSFVGRFANMNYGYATQSLLWDDNNIPENSAHVYCSPYQAMVPIVKATFVVGSARTPVIVRQCQSATQALADAANFGDADFINKLSNLARLEIVAGINGDRAGTIWYYRNGNYCFVVASYLRSTAPDGTARYLPLLAAQFFGYRYVGTHSGIPVDLRDLAMTWDRFTGIPLPELAPLATRLSGTQEFVLTFNDTSLDPSAPPLPEPPPGTNGGSGGGGTEPNPDPNCEANDLHLYESGWTYDGCLWSHTDQPEGTYFWQPSVDGRGGAWTPIASGTEINRSQGDPITVNYGYGTAQIGWSVNVTYADGNGGTYQGTGADYSGWPYGTQIGGYYNQNFYADGNGGYYEQDYDPGYPAAGTVVSTDQLSYPTIDWSGFNQIGTFVFCDSAWRDWHADGSGGTYWDGGYYNQVNPVSEGAVIWTDGSNTVYFTGGNGGQFPGYYTS